MKITELRGNSQVFTLADKTTLRLLPRETKTIPSGNVSEELRIAQNMGLISMSPRRQPAVLKEEVLCKDSQITQEAVEGESFTVKKKQGGTK